MSRLDNLTEAQLEQHLSSLEADLAAMKSAGQRMGAATRFFYSDTGATYDWSGVLPGGQLYLIVSATAQTMEVMFANLVVYLYAGSSATWYRPPDIFNDLSTGATPFVVRAYEIPSVSGNTNQVSKLVSITGDSRTVRVKAYMYGLDQATVTVNVA